MTTPDLSPESLRKVLEECERIERDLEVYGSHYFDCLVQFRNLASPLLPALIRRELEKPKPRRLPPTETGWWWMKATAESPTPSGFLRMGIWVLVLVGSSGDGRPIVHFPQATYTVEALNAWWCGPILPPEGSADA